MKTLRRVLLVVLLLVVVGGIVFYLYLDRVLKRTVETQATESLKLQTTLGGASLSLFGGKLGLDQLAIASPQGFSAPHMLTLGKANVVVSYGQLRNDPVHVASITLDQPMLVVEQANGAFNFKKAADAMTPATPAPTGGPTAPAPPQGNPEPAAPAGESKPLKLIIDELTIKDAKVVIRPGLNIPGVPAEINVPIATMTMRNVGTGDGNQNGAAVKDIVMQVVTALVAQANSSDLIPKELQALLNGDLSTVMNRLGAEAQQRVLAAVPGEAGKVLSQIVADPSALTKDPGKVVGSAVQGLKDKIPGIPGLPGAPTTGPAGPSANPLDDPAKSIGGLLGGNKQKKDKSKK